MLQLQGIRKSFVAGTGECATAVRVLDGICLTISAGQVIVLSAGAGSGKTTLLWCAAGLLEPDGGERRCIGGASGEIHYWSAPHDWRRAVVRDRIGPPALHLFDEPETSQFAGARAEFAAVLRRLALARHATVIATAAPLRDWIPLMPRGARYYHLERGRLIAALRPPERAMAMVAERRAPAFG